MYASLSGCKASAFVGGGGVLSPGSQAKNKMPTIVNRIKIFFMFFPFSFKVRPTVIFSSATLMCFTE
jgi:hypothetical protein